ncbi:phytanoyl-CoA dioxygenase family protein [Rhodobacterales bacterium HKCCE2091]|nr:phytanoyl-CoA dioxygenase family protein [Rhodobacterales bacterium HKCCE2091]
MLIPTKSEMRAYEVDGYFVREGFLSPSEVEDFRGNARRKLEAESAAGEVMEKGDKSGNKTLLKMWNTAGDDKFGMLARDERMVRMSEALLGEDIYLYSHKMTMKQPREGGAWEWHQDFAYWYNNGCLSPDMLSIFISLDASTKANGCLQVLKGSHALGRIDHVREDGQTNVNMEYLAEAEKRFEHVYVEMAPGDALVFHGNLLHRSDANNSDSYRWGYICSYNTVANAPFKRTRDYGNYEELRTVPAGSFMSAAE